MRINNIINHVQKKNWIKAGRVVYVRYILIKEDEIKISNFIGLCIARKNKSNSLLIKNNVKKEDIKLLIHTHSPLIVSFKILKRYKKKYRLNKLYYK
jgi:ribosomal protein L19